MKKLLISLIAICLSASAMADFYYSAVPANVGTSTVFNGKKFYINPGHGGWCEYYDRHMPTIPFPQYKDGHVDTLGFWESSSNLKVALDLWKMFEAYGATVKMSRYTNQAGTYDNGYKDYDGKTISVSNTKIGDRGFASIKDEAQLWGANFMLSIHSNGNNGATNTLHHYIPGPQGENWTYGGHERISGNIACSKYIYDAVWYDPVQHWNANTSGNHEYYTFYSSLGMLSTSGSYGGFKNGPTVLSEACFHDYAPNAHRYLNRDYQKFEAYRFFWGIIDWVKGTKNSSSRPSTGLIVGDVRNTTILNNSTYRGNATDAQLGGDKYTPLNGAKAELLQNGNVIKTYQVDNYYNGLFFFFDLTPGNYKVRLSCNKYATETFDVVVKAGTVSGFKATLSQGSVDPSTCNPDGWSDKGEMVNAFISDLKTACGFSSLDIVSAASTKVQYCYSGTWSDWDVVEGAHHAVNMDEGFLAGPTWNASSKIKTWMESSTNTKWAWLKTYIQGLAGTSLEEAQWRGNLEGWILCSPSGTYNADYTNAGNYSFFKTAWGYKFCGETPSTDTMYTVTLAANPVAAASLLSGAGTYKKGATVTIKASSNTSYTFKRWSDGDSTATRSIKVNGNVTYTAEFEAATPGPTPPPAGDCNPYGWKDGNDMYKALAVDVKAAKAAGMNFVFTSDFAAATEFGAPTIAHDVSGISLDIQEFDENFFTTSPYKEKWGWLLNYLDERCNADGKAGPISAGDSHNALIRYNLAAFFANGQTTIWPITADYTSYGVASTQYFTLWGTNYCTGTTEVEQVVDNILNGPVAIYSITGMYMGNSIENLAHGVYVVVGNGRTMKIAK